MSWIEVADNMRMLELSPVFKLYLWWEEGHWRVSLAHKEYSFSIFKERLDGVAGDQEGTAKRLALLRASRLLSELVTSAMEAHSTVSSLLAETVKEDVMKMAKEKKDEKD